MGSKERLERLQRHARARLGSGGGALEGGLEAYVPDAATTKDLADAAVGWSKELADRHGIKPDDVARTLERLRASQPWEARDGELYEAIILPKERPVAEVVDDRVVDLPAGEFRPLLDDAPTRARLEAALPAIGCVLVPEDPRSPYWGTAFVVGPGLLMTNRHVASVFASGLGTHIDYVPGAAAFTPKREAPTPVDEPRVRVERVVMIHPYWDMALLEVPALRTAPLTLAAGAVDAGRQVAVVGYPALDPRNDAKVQNDVFRGLYYVKRLSPGYLAARATVASFQNQVSAATHDASTLGGNSGSAVLDVASGKVVALHFAGRYLERNYAVPTWELARDARVAALGLRFDGPAPGGPTPWDERWDATERAREREAPPPPRSAPPPPREPAPAGRAVVRLQVPIEIEVRVGEPGAAPTARVAEVEGLVEPRHDTSYGRRRGYDPDFLGISVPLPKPRDLRDVSKLDDGEHAIPYEHFSVVMKKARRLALFTASNVDGRPEKRRPPGGGDFSRKGLTGLGKNDQEQWITDPRIPATHQLPDRFYNKDRQAFDKGHIVRREDVCWGRSYEQIVRANGDTFHTTNCSPQVAGFNRSNLHGRWGELENEILAQAKAERYAVFAGPVFSDDDPAFDGVDDRGAIVVQIPQQFWKVVVARGQAGLEAFAFLLSQDLSDVRFEEFAVPEGWETELVALSELEAQLELTFPKVVHDADQFDRPGGEAIRRLRPARAR